MITTSIHERNGRAETDLPLMAAAKAETRMIEQLDAMSQRLDRLGITALQEAKQRLADSAANLADRIADARAFAASTVTRVAHLLSNLCDDLSDDVTRADEAVPIEKIRADLKAAGIDTSKAAKRVLDAVHQAQAAPAKLEGGGPADDEDYYDLVSNAGRQQAKAGDETPRVKHAFESEAWGSEVTPEPSDGERHEAAKQVHDALMVAHNREPQPPAPPAKPRKKRRGRS